MRVSKATKKGFNYPYYFTYPALVDHYPIECINKLPTRVYQRLAYYTNFTILNWEEIKEECRYMSLRLPHSNNLFKGAVIPIYRGYKDEKDFEGYARLINREKSLHQPPNLYSRGREGSPKYWSWQRWKVEFVMSHIYKTGFVTHRNIAYFNHVNNFIPRCVGKENEFLYMT